MKLSLGPNLYYWPREQLLEFYERMKAAPVEVIYLGETVCSKRRPFRGAELLELARELAAAGKEVVLSSLTLLEAASERSAMRRLCGNGEFLVEASDLSAVSELSRQGLPFVAGPAVNIYNGRALKLLAGQGMRRWVMPVELSAAALGRLLGEAAELGVDVETEVFGYGRLPLAYSARCFTARHHDLPKDACEFKCLDYPDGLPVRTQEGNEFLTINGIQTQSGEVQDLAPEIPAMAALGVSHVRLSPRTGPFGQVIERYRAAADGEVVAAEPGSCNGYWYGEVGMAQGARGAALG